MSDNLGNFLISTIQRGRQATQDRATLNTLAQYMSDQNDAQGEQAAQRGKQAASLRNVIKQYAPDDPNIGHAINAMGVDQLEGVMHGLALNSAMDKAQAENERNQAETGWYKQRASEQADEGGAMAQFAQNLAKTPTAQDPMALYGGASNGPTQGDIFGAMASMGQTNPRMAGIILSKVLPSLLNGEGGLKPNSYEDQVTGARYMLYGKTAQPAGYNPAKLAQPQPITDGDGKELGWAYPTGKSVNVHWTDKNIPDGSTIKTINGVNVVTDKENNIVKTIGNANPQIEMLKHLMGNNGTSAAPEAGGSAYKSAEDVRAAFNAGKLDKAGASKILREQFGFK